MMFESLEGNSYQVKTNLDTESLPHTIRSIINIVLHFHLIEGVTSHKYPFVLGEGWRLLHGLLSQDQQENALDQHFRPEVLTRLDGSEDWCPLQAYKI